MRARVSFRETGGAQTMPLGFAGRAVVARPAGDLTQSLVFWTVLLLPVNWICGTTPFFLYGVALILLMRARSLSLLEVEFAWLIAAFLLGLAVAIPGGGVPPGRALASVYNMTIAVVLIAFLSAGRGLCGPDREAGRQDIYRAAWLLFGFNALLVVVVFGVTKTTGDYAISIRTLVLGLLGRLPGVLGEYGQVDLSVTDWTTAGPETRVVGFGIYATEGALLFMLLGLLAGIKAFAERRFWRFAAIEAAIAVGLIIMASRTTLLAYLVSVLLLCVLQRRALLGLVLLTAPVLIVGAVIVALYGGDAIGHWLVEQNGSRLGSSGTRFLSYATAVSMVMAQNPLTGLGIKPLDPALLLIPIGSHSTLSSSFAKGGFVALGVVATIYVTLLAGIVRSQYLARVVPLRPIDAAQRIELVQLSRCVAVILVWWVTEDFDAPAYEAAFAGLCLGLFWGCLDLVGRRVNHPE